jgi:hypothetical protein
MITRFRPFAIGLVAAVALLAATPSRADGPKDKGPEWLLLVTPTAGWLRNEARITFKVPVENGYDEHTATLTDDGWGAGLVAVGVYRFLSLTDVFFFFPDVNSSRLVGNIAYFAGEIPTGTFVEPYLGVGYVFVSTDTDYDDFKYSIEQAGMIGYATFPRISVDNVVSAPFPKAGLKFKIPVQHWYATPFYSLMYEDVRTHARSPGGHVEIYEPGGREAGDEPEMRITVPAFDTNLHKTYLSHLVGTDLFVDFHYFLQLRAKVYYNTSYDLWTVRLIGSFLFSKHVGISAYFEYTEKITVTNTYFLVGPAFVFTPPGFLDGVRQGG